MDQIRQQLEDREGSMMLKWEKAMNGEDVWDELEAINREIDALRRALGIN